MNIRSCQNCHYSSNEDFKQVANLKNSGLIIYIHGNKSKPKRYNGDHSGNNIILHNTSNRDIKRFDYIVELCQYRTKCLKCKMLIQRVRNAIDDISTISKNEVIGVCDFCKRSHQKNKCKRCQYIVQKFVNIKSKQNENRDEQLKSWLSKLQQILISVLEAKVICRHNICLDFEYKTQLSKLLHSLNKTDISIRQPEIDPFPELFDLKDTDTIDISESRKILDDLVTQLKNNKFAKNADEGLSGSSSGSEKQCICKYFVNNKHLNKPGPSVEIMPQREVSLSKLSIAKGDKEELNKSTLMTSFEHQKQYKSKSEIVIEKSVTGQKSKLTDTSNKTQYKNLKSYKENGSSNEIYQKQYKSKSEIGIEKSKTGQKKKKKSNKENETSNEIINNNVKKGKEKGKKEKQGSEYRLMMQMLKEREKEKKLLEKLGKRKKNLALPTIKPLPDLKAPKKRVKADNLEREISESVLECKDEQLEVITEMIKGTKIVNLDSHSHDIDEGLAKLPLLYKNETNLTTPTKNKESISLPKNNIQNQKNGKEVPIIYSGIIKYELSNRDFIDKGWTKLPSINIMRRMNIYKMLPTSPKFDWFKSYKKQEFLFYDTGEKFSEINDAGGGKWFYKNGNVALDAHCTEDSNTVKRYVIYSSGEETINGKKEPTTILACFDYLGNGVVYDCYGNARLKYNQSEGVLIDKRIAAPGRWKWHTLNEPPVLQQVFHNTYDKSDNNDWIKDFNTGSENIRQPNEEMIAIELENFVKEKAHKLMQKFKPFQIKIKVLKINDYFSLRIIDQANIFLLFRCDRIYFKLNIGMLLKSDEIIDTDIAEVSEVSTPYDKFPPRSPSLINIQNTLGNVRKRYGSSKKNK